MGHRASTKSYDAMFAPGVVISHVKFVRIVNFVDKISEQEKSKFIPPPSALNPNLKYHNVLHLNDFYMNLKKRH